MAVSVSAQAVGGSLKIVENVTTVADVKKQLGLPNYTATVNGEPAEDGEELEANVFVSLAPAVKGA